MLYCGVLYVVLVLCGVCAAHRLCWQRQHPGRNTLERQNRVHVTLSLPVITNEGLVVYKCTNMFVHVAAVGPRLILSYPFLLAYGGALARLAGARHLFLTITHPCLFLPPPHQTIWSTFLLCLRIWPILCTQFMTMARVVVGSGGSDILCC